MGLILLSFYCISVTPILLFLKGATMKDGDE